MEYFVTGATGFIGRFLVGELLKRPGARVHALVRKGSEGKLDEVRLGLGASAEQLVAVHGDLTRAGLGLDDSVRASLAGHVDHFFHLAAIYDLKADADSQMRTNLEGTRNALDAAAALEVGCFHQVSSIAAAGTYAGRFSETMFDEATGLADPYFYTKHESEGLVRKETRFPWRVYRPSMVVGHSKTGAMDKIDGPYFIFRLLNQVRRFLPAWFPLVGIEGGQFNIVPVDYVVEAMDHIAHQPGLDGKVFHLTAEDHYTLAELFNMVAKQIGAPGFKLWISNNVLNKGPIQVVSAIGQWPPVKVLTDKVLQRLDLPTQMLGYLTFPTTYDRSQTKAALAGSGITPPPLESYIEVLRRYWAAHLNR